MKTFSVRDLRQRWPEAEALLRSEREIIITRDSKPVAKLVRFTAPRKPRKRFDPVAHAKWQHRVSGGRGSRWRGRPPERRVRGAALSRLPGPTGGVPRGRPVPLPALGGDSVSDRSSPATGRPAAALPLAGPASPGRHGGARAPASGVGR